MHKRSTIRAAAMLGAGALAVGLSGCSADAGTGSPDEPMTVNAGFIPVVDVAALYLGEEQGFFDENGIDLNINVGASGAALLPSVMSGEYTFAFSNMPSILQAKDKGLPVKIIGSGSSSTGVEGEDVTMIHAPEDSGITGAKDLEGKTVSVNALGSLLEMLGKIGVDADGGDSSKVEFIELPFAESLTALENGTIDAMVGAEPFGTAAIEAGFPAISSPYQAMSTESIMTSAYYTSEDQLNENPELFADLQVAINESLAYAQEHPDEVREQLLKFTELDEDVAAKMILPTYDAEISAEAVDLFNEYALEYDLIETAVDPAELIATPEG
ncbi:ABC transporter substrate-binding protein [Citricoccus parietis]